MKNRLTRVYLPKVLHRHTMWIVFGCLAGITNLGCEDGPPRIVTVSGTVLIDGQPVEHGNIRVFPENARAASGKLGPGGRFELTTYEKGDGCVLGTHAVIINALESIDANSQRWHAPAKYCQAATSGLTIAVSEATDDVEFNLTWDGGQPFIERSAAAGGD